MKNKMTDLNDHLFAELERLGDEDLTDEKLKFEIDRARGVSAVAGRIIENARLSLEATKLTVEYGRGTNLKLPPMLETSDGKRTPQ